jgi:hypothetical protein
MGEISSEANTHLLRALKSWPRPITVATVLVCLSASWCALFALDAVGKLGMPLLQAIGLPMQITVIGMAYLLMARFLKNRPENSIRSVPTPVRIIVPIAIALGVLQLRLLLPGVMPSNSPSGAPVHSFNAGVESGICVAVYNGSERVTEPLAFCTDFQSRFDRVFAGAWLIASALELWGAWALYGAAPGPRSVATPKLE